LDAVEDLETAIAEHIVRRQRAIKQGPPVVNSVDRLAIFGLDAETRSD
jgi:hypothetical protein